MPYRMQYPKLRETNGKNGRVFTTVVVVRCKVNGILVNIVEHVERESVHLRLGVSVSSGRVAVNITEVSVSVYEGIAEREILRHTNHSVINRGVTVGMITTEHRTDGIGALTVSLIGCQSVFIHCVKNSSVNRL